MQNSRSIASGHYPRIRIRDGERLLWNPLKKQTFRQRPEERVRLQITDFLILQSHIPAARITTEAPVPSRHSRGRTDILCYDSGFEPWLLVECKADSIKLSHKTALQSAHYNRFLQAPYIMLTNGNRDVLFDMSSQPVSLNPADYPLEIRPAAPFHSRDPKYWTDRGFLPANMETGAAKSLSALLCSLFHESAETCSYLALSLPHENIPYGHFYLLTHAPHYPDTLLALTILAVDHDQAIMVAAANRHSKNTGFLKITIDRNGSFQSPELIITENDNIITPDISYIEQICLDPASFETDETSEDLTATLALMLEKIFIYKL